MASFRVVIEQGEATGVSLDEKLCGIIQRTGWMLAVERGLFDTKLDFNV
jgi:hypothetical protein